ncbi:MAG: hypothetical protein ABIE43_00775, partial [Patescibacteria group bacterium]
FFLIILNNKITYLILILIILIQFILVSIIFFENKKNKILIEEATINIVALKTRINQVYDVLQPLQSQLIRMSSQLYRLQNEQ